MNLNHSHGGQVYQIAKQLGCPVEALTDFSASINPLGPPASVLKAMRIAVNECQHYPDSNSEDLRAQLAHLHKISPESILVSNGSAEIIRLLPSALGLRYACIVGPTFSDYQSSLYLAGVKAITANAASAQRYAPPPGKIFKVLSAWKRVSRRENCKPKGQHHALFVCNPNSPTGRRMSHKDLKKILGEVNQIGCWMIVDEAFMDWSPSHSLMKDLSPCPRLIILRSFTKFYSIPGIRLGYLVAAPDVVTSIRKHLPLWSVNHVAQAAGVAAVQDQRFRSRSQKFMQRERENFLRELRCLPQLRVIPSQANFIMVEIPSGGRAEEIVRRLQEQGIVVRDCQTFTGVTSPAFRFAVRLRRDNHRLVQALKKILE